MRQQYILKPGDLAAFRRSLQARERSRATVEKYLREAEAFLHALDPGRAVTKEQVLAWKESLAQRYAVSTVNGKLAALNSLFAFLGWQDCQTAPLRRQRELFRDQRRELTRGEYLRLVEAALALGKERLALLLVTILYRLAGEPEPGGDSGFSDVAAGTWYTDAVAWAAENGIVNGVNDTEFAPGDDLTRQQLVTILYRYAESKGYDVSASADLSGYPDAGQVQDYAQPAMAWAVAEGIVEGMDGTLNPAGNASRAQIATILMRFCEGIQP